ncbi:MAG TPA: DUF4199 domain-containing protein [Bacteroidales bacterium]|nr:DUF4199 domain-containing protein [Bacteroidales bacterium]HSA43248.1 DUF4199 domain-containing protein [Bacteroidales bacterium]
MENQKPSVLGNCLRYALILAVISILYSLLLYSLGQMQNKVLGFLAFAVLLVVMIWAVKDFRDKKSGGFVSFGTAFRIGFFTGLFAGIITGIYTYLFFKYFDPEMIGQMLAKAEENFIEQNPNMDDSQIELAMSYTRRFMQPAWMAFWGFLWNAVVSAVLGLIVAAIMKKEENPMNSAV